MAEIIGNCRLPLAAPRLENARLNEDKCAERSHDTRKRPGKHRDMEGSYEQMTFRREHRAEQRNYKKTSGTCDCTIKT
jgi:hypothetical protein